MRRGEEGATTSRVREATIESETQDPKPLAKAKTPTRGASYGILCFIFQ